jgi:DHA1 family bicyclomycin/chloramphenicol resistance-like MFS transporter
MSKCKFANYGRGRRLLCAGTHGQAPGPALSPKSRSCPRPPCVSRPRQPAPHLHADRADRPRRAVDEHLPAVAARDDGAFRHRLPADAAVGRALPRGQRVLQIVVGPISDRYGRRPVLLWGIVIFLLATLGCILAPTIEVFLAFRMLQAVVVVGLVLGRAVVRDMYPPGPGRQPDRLCHDGHGRGADDRPGHRRRAGRNPRLAGEFLDAGDPRGARPRPRLARPGRNRRRGAASFAEQFANTPSFSPRAASGATASAAAFASGAFFAYLGGAPYVGSEVFGLSAGEVGLYFGAPALGYFFGNWLSGRYSVRVGHQRHDPVGHDPLAGGLPCRSCCSSGSRRAARLLRLHDLRGLGNGMVLPNATSGMLSVRPHLAGTASGLGRRAHARRRRGALGAGRARS